MAQLIPAGQGHLLAQVVGQLGPQHLRAEQGVGGIAHVVRGDGADMPGGVPRRVDDLEADPPGVEGAV